MPEVGLDRAGVDALVSQLKSAGMTKHVRVDLHFEAGSLGSAFYHRLEATLGERHASICTNIGTNYITHHKRLMVADKAWRQRRRKRKSPDQPAFELLTRRADDGTFGSTAKPRADRGADKE